jgi:hypothetical protein
MEVLIHNNPNVYLGKDGLYIPIYWAISEKFTGIRFMKLEREETLLSSHADRRGVVWGSTEQALVTDQCSTQQPFAAGR